MSDAIQSVSGSADCLDTAKMDGERLTDDDLQVNGGRVVLYSLINRLEKFGGWLTAYY